MGRPRTRAAVMRPLSGRCSDRHRMILIRLAVDASDMGFVAQPLDDVWVVQFESRSLRSDSETPRIVDHHRLAVARAREDVPHKRQHIMSISL